MHGIIHKALKEYVTERLSADEWSNVLDEADIDPKLYLPVSHYPDEEITAIIGVLSDRTGNTEHAIQRDFGEFLAPQLMDTFKAHIKAGWGIREILLALDPIYDQIRAQNEESTPPDVDCDEVARGTLVLTYRSDRQLCSMAKGIIVGTADYVDDAVEVSEDACMHEGDDRCELTVEIQ